MGHASRRRGDRAAAIGVHTHQLRAPNGVTGSGSAPPRTAAPPPSMPGECGHPNHVLLCSCPALMRNRHRLMGTIVPVRRTRGATTPCWSWGPLTGPSRAAWHVSALRRRTQQRQLLLSDDSQEKRERADDFIRPEIRSSSARHGE